MQSQPKQRRASTALPPLDPVGSLCAVPARPISLEHHGIPSAWAQATYWTAAPLGERLSAGEGMGSGTSQAGTIILPIGQSAIPASFKCAQAGFRLS